MSIDRVPAGAVSLPLPTPPERHEVNELMRAVRSYTYPVLFNSQNPQLGTAVLIRHGQRLLAITAAHNIADDTSIHVRLSLGAGRTQFDILDTYIHPNYDPKPETSKFDLAILELDPNTSVPAGDAAQLYTGGFEKVSDGTPTYSSRAYVWVVGYPVELVKPGEGRATLLQTAFATQLLDHAPDELSLYYPETAYQMPHDGVTCEEGDLTLTPRGRANASKL